MSEFTLDDCETKVREILNDTVKSQRQINIYEASDVFTLEEENPTAVTAVLKNDIVQATNVWTYSSTTGKLTISFVCSVGDVIEIQYSSYEKYSSSEIQNFIKRALVELSVNKYVDLTVDESSAIVYYDVDEEESATAPTFEIQNLIALIASVLMKPENKSYRLPDFQVTVASSKPTYMIIREIISQYKRNKSGIVDILPPYEELEEE